MHIMSSIHTHFIQNIRGSESRLQVELIMDGNAAAILDEGARTVRNVKGKQFNSLKHSLASPYSCKWPDLPSGTVPLILEEITRTFQPLHDVLAKRKTKNRKRTEKRRAEMTEGDRAQERQKKELRSQLALGVNEVTRFLERGELRLVMVCRSAKPEIMTSHLCALSATRECPAIAVHQLSKTLAPLLNMKAIMAIGFKKLQKPSSVTAFNEFVTSIIKRCPPIQIPWLELKELPPKDLAEILSRSAFKGHRKVVQEKKQFADDGMCLKRVNTDKPDNEQDDDELLRAKSHGENPGNTQDEELTKVKVSGRTLGTAQEKRPLEDTAVVKELDNTKSQRESAGQATTGQPYTGSEVSSSIPEGVQRTEGDVQGTSREESSPQEPHTSRKRKFESVQSSPNSEVDGKKKQKILKVPFASTNVKSIKIISKVLKGKKKKRKGKK